MKHYLMLPQDTIRVLLPEDGQEACVELFCERVRAMEEEGTVSYWSILFNAENFSDMLEDALGLCGPDALFGTEYLVLLPQSHPGFETFDETIRRYVPEIETKPYRPLTCDQNGHHHD